MLDRIPTPPPPKNRLIAQSRRRPPAGAGDRTIKRLILVIDDHQDSARALARLLSHKGHDAVSVTSGNEAMTFLDENTPQMIICDMMMPGMDGRDVLREVRAKVRFRDTPILMFSADEDGREDAERLGATDYFVKCSVAPSELVSRICDAA